MTRTQMEQFERVLVMAKCGGPGADTNLPTAELLLEDSAALKFYEAWIKRQKKARNWEKKDA